MTPLRDFASPLERFRAGQCRRRPRTWAEVLGAFRRRDKRRAYFAVRHKAELAADRKAMRKTDGDLRLIAKRFR